MKIKQEELDISDVDESTLLPDTPSLIQNKIQDTETNKYKHDIKRDKRKNKQGHKNENLMHHICQVCSKGFSRLDSLGLHMVTHTKEKKFECVFCKKKYARKGALSRHLKGGHEPKDHKGRHPRRHLMERNHICELCGKGFTTSSILRIHLISHSEERKFECAICGAKFKMKDTLSRHLKACYAGLNLKSSRAQKLLKERNHICRVCNKGFIRAYHLRSHMFSHSEERKFECTICGAKFKMKCVLSRHLKSSCAQKLLKERNHICKVCSKGFKRANHLSNHMLSHSEERKFECAICGAKYKRKYALSQHLKAFSGGVMDHIRAPKL